jgi:hypothetical protein
MPTKEVNVHEQRVEVVEVLPFLEEAGSYISKLSVAAEERISESAE